MGKIKAEEIKNENTEEIESIKQKAFMEGYQYAIQVLQDGIIKNDRLK